MLKQSLLANCNYFTLNLIDMKKLTIIILFLVAFSSNAQDLLSIQNWSDSIAFRWSHPTIRGYSALSDSLADAIPGNAEFYYHDGSYYAITSWADYYYWFTKAYWYRFDQPVAEYEVFYVLGDNFMMVDWLARQSKKLKRNGLLDLKDPFSRGLAQFTGLYDKKQLSAIGRARSNETATDLPALTNRSFSSSEAGGFSSAGETGAIGSSSSGSSGVSEGQSVRKN